MWPVATYGQCHQAASPGNVIGQEHASANATLGEGANDNLDSWEGDISAHSIKFGSQSLDANTQ